MQPIVIIGSGLAGYTLAKEFRQYDTATPLYIITKDAGHFYSKPLLSTALTQKKTADMLSVFSAEQMAQQLNATILTHTEVTKIDGIEQVLYYDQQTLAYKKLVLACGADAVMPELSGDAVDAVHSINDLTAYTKFRKEIQAQNKIAIIGAGLVGCEFANDLINTGHQVTVIAPNPYPLANWLPNTIASVLQNALAQQGVVWLLEQTVTTIEKAAIGYDLLLTQGRIQADAVLAAIGLKPRTALAETAGIRVNRGIVVDRNLHTNVNNIYAVGDCAEVDGRVMLFIAPLLQAARALAKTLADNLSQVDYPLMPIVLKTSLCPLVMLPPPTNAQGSWQLSGEGKDRIGLFYENDRLRGFVLTGAAVRERARLINAITADNQQFAGE